MTARGNRSKIEPVVPLRVLAMKFLILFALIVVALVIFGIARRQSSLSDTEKDYDDRPSGPGP